MAGEREQLQPAGRLISSFKSLNGRGGGNTFRGHGPSSCVVCHGGRLQEQHIALHGLSDICQLGG